MSDQFVAEIRIFPFNFPPTGWAFCDGQLMPISQNTALFSLLGTVYGGDGKSTFALPDLQGNAPMQPGQGQGLSQRDLGEMSGVESVTLLVSEIPVHTHAWQANAAPATQTAPPMTDSSATLSPRTRRPSTRATPGIRKVVAAARVAPKRPAAMAIRLKARPVPSTPSARIDSADAHDQCARATSRMPSGAVRRMATAWARRMTGSAPCRC